MKNKIDLLLLNLGHALIATANNANVAAAQTLEVIDGGKTEESPAPTSATKTDKKLPNPERKTYTKAEPPKTKAERDLFKIHWESLGKEGLQDEYNAGKVDSEGGVLEVDEFDTSEFDAPADEVKTFTTEEVRKALQKYAKINGKDAAYKVLSSVGAKKIADIEEDKFAAVMKEIA